MTGMPMIDGSADPLARARSIAPLLEERADQAEHDRTLPAESVQAMADAGLFRLFLPRELGGEEPDFITQVAIYEELARADGSAGWTLIANGPSGAFAGAYLGDSAVAKIFARGPAPVFGGQFAPRGRGVVEDGGYRVSGDWNFGSGIAHSSYVMGGFTPIENGEPRQGENGLPEMRVAVMPRDRVWFKDGWHVMGLQGTGSFDYEAIDVFVPDDWTFPLFPRRQRRGGPLFSMGLFPVVAAGHAGWALGVGRRALDEIRELSRTTQRMGDPTCLAQRATFQRDYMRAEAKLRAARLLVVDEYEQALAAARGGERPGPEQRALLRTAASYATEAAKEVCDFAHLAAGTAAIRNDSVLQRCFRDIHTGTQHAFIHERIYLESAEIWLGNKPDSVML